jgi:hypothetical protein
VGWGGFFTMVNSDKTDMGNGAVSGARSWTFDFDVPSPVLWK